MASQSDILSPLTLEELVTIFRELADDMPGDMVEEVNWKNDDTGLLWSNREIVGYANQAQIEFCHRQPILDRASTPSLTQIVVTAGTARYNYGAQIMAIKAAKYVDDNDDEFDLIKRTSSEMDDTFSDWDKETNGTQAVPSFYVEDTDHRAFWLYPTPLVGGTVHMIVDRLPVTQMQWKSRHTNTPEIDPQFHYDLVDWMLHRAYLKVDAETYSQTLSDRFATSFEERVGPRPTARLLRVRRQERNMPRHVRAEFF
jgi:hypothetical protein